MRSSSVVLLILFSAFLSNCASDDVPYEPEVAVYEFIPREQAPQEYTFQVGDVFDIKFYEHDNLSQSVVVRPDGKISLPLVEEVDVLNLTPDELDKIITDSYSKKIVDPEVTIILKQFAGRKVYVGGEVFRPGVITLEENLTLLQSIFHSGGFNRNAEMSSVLVIRNKRDSIELHTVDAERIMNGEAGFFVLHPYDVVYVPKTFITKVGDFVDQYINEIIPRPVHAGFNFVYAMKTNDNTRTIVVSE